MKTLSLTLKALIVATLVIHRRQSRACWGGPKPCAGCCAILSCGVLDGNIEFILHPWHLLVLALFAWINHDQEKVNEYLRVENQVLGEKLG